MFQLLIRGGWMMLPLALCSVVAVTIIIERFLFFRRIGASHRGEEVLALIRRGDTDDALGITDETALLPVMKVLSVGITHRFEPGGAMEAAAIAELSLMRRGLVALDTIITLSPLLGLLGTIIGMIDSFNIMATTGLGQPHAVTGGVAEALICTAAGIAVAVVTLIPYNYFTARVDREAESIEAYATRLELALSAQPKE
ncbi:MAG: MotA/TolQ/ExbB proton channel family protein [Proteobacteria bacterium]|nr:MotA/TolQ/ExbB proton channel family protein [Pseudomonadota bacterium]